MSSELERSYRWTERWIALTAVAWLGLLAVTGWPSTKPRTRFIWSLGHTEIVAIAVLGLCLCAALPRRNDAALDRCVAVVPALASGALFWTALDTSLVGFHAPYPPTWEIAMLIAAAGLVAIVGGALRRRPRIHDSRHLHHRARGRRGGRPRSA